MSELFIFGMTSVALCFVGYLITYFFNYRAIRREALYEGRLETLRQDRLDAYDKIQVLQMENANLKHRMEEMIQ